MYSNTYNAVLSGGQLNATNGSTTSPDSLQVFTVYDFGNPLRSGGGDVDFSTTDILASSFAFSFLNSATPNAFLQPRATIPPWATCGSPMTERRTTP